MYQRILVPLDGSATARSGLAEAVLLGKSLGARLRVIHALSDAFLNPPELHGIRAPDFQQELRSEAQSSLDAAAIAARDAGIEVETAVIEHHNNHIGDVIIKEAERWRADLIAMGTHGRHGIARTLLGSVAEHVVRHTPVPVLLVRS